MFPSHGKDHVILTVNITLRDPVLGPVDQSLNISMDYSALAAWAV